LLEVVLIIGVVGMESELLYHEVQAPQVIHECLGNRSKERGFRVGDPLINVRLKAVDMAIHLHASFTDDLQDMVLVNL
jgi:hypothetical protein